MQFDEASDRYRCCCECFHVKTAATAVGVFEMVVVFVLLVNSLVLLANADHPNRTIDFENDTKESTLIWGSDSALVWTPLVIGFCSLAVAFFAVCFLFFGIARRSHYLLLPHLVVQFVATFLLLCGVVDGILAFITDRIFFYRFLNAVDFTVVPSENTVALRTSQAAWIYVVFGVYCIMFVLEIWFVRLVWLCYGYFKDRRSYMNYCLEYSTPMRTVHVRVPQYGTR